MLAIAFTIVGMGVALSMPLVLIAYALLRIADVLEKWWPE